MMMKRGLFLSEPTGGWISSIDILASSPIEERHFFFRGQNDHHDECEIKLRLLKTD
jgi:hypothetical protein